MPEIAEVTRIVHFLRSHLKNRRIASVTAEDDNNVYGKVGTSAAAVKAALTGRTIVDAKQQGKYFWLEMDKPPHLLMHFGMTGWIKFRHLETGYYKPEKNADGKKQSKLKFHDGNDDKDQKPEEQAWPPRFHKFVLKMQGDPACEAAFVDARRFGRVRLVDVPAKEMRNTSPLKENGPDPVIDKDIFTEEWFTTLVHSKKAPIKAVLLEQSNISGIGNWVGDEVLYNAAIHPEQYSNTLSTTQCKKLYKSLMYICDTACELLADSDRFPDHWLFKHRWNKGKNQADTLPNGAKIVYVTVGGRTSAVVPSVQKKTGPVAADVEDESSEDLKEEEDEETKPKPAPKKKTTKNADKAVNGTAKGKKRKTDAAKSEDSTSKKSKPSPSSKQAKEVSKDEGRRRSGRLSRS